MENQIVQISRIYADDIIARSEEYYENEVTALAQNAKIGYKFVFIAGPSSSGKTTTAALLKKKLAQIGMDSIILSMDNFFKDYDDLPKYSNGDTDFDSPAALNVSAINTCLHQLLTDNRTIFPDEYDFKNSERKAGKLITITPDTIVIMEGLHALNRDIFDRDLDNFIYRVYVSVRSDFYENEKKIIGCNDVRLIRRIIRDHKFRSSTISNTLGMWGGVCFSEEQYIKRFRDTASFIVNTAIHYEPRLYEKYLSPLVKGMDTNDTYYPQAAQLLKKIHHFKPLNDSFVPEYSLLREFIG